MEGTSPSGSARRSPLGCRGCSGSFGFVEVEIGRGCELRSVASGVNGGQVLGLKLVMATVFSHWLSALGRGIGHS